MITTKPINVTMSMLSSSTVPYPDTGETLWNSGTNYAAGATVSYQINGVYHRFESKQGSNLNHIPQAYPDDKNNAWWIDLGYVNRISAFQLERSTQTITASPYTVKINPNDRVGVVGIGNVEADSVTIKVYNSSGTLIQTQTKNLLVRSVYDWYSYTFAPFQQLKSTLFTDLPINSTYSIELTFLRATGSVKVGAIVMGMPLDIGRALMGGVGVRLINFSLFERDEFGESKITIRRNIPEANFQLLIDKPRLNAVLRMLNDLNGVVTMWAGTTEAEHGYFENTFVIGMYKDFGNTIDQPNYVQADLKVEAI